MRKAFVLLLAFSAGVFSQGPNNRQRGNSPSAEQLILAQTRTIEGVVTAVNIEYGIQYPSIKIGQDLIKVAPVWYLLEKNIEIQTGDRLKVVAAPCRADGYLYAITIQNTVTSASITLRDSNGVPFWMKGRGMQGNPDTPRAGGGCIDAASVTTVSGVIESVKAGAGIQMPLLVVKTAEGLVSIKIGPERELIEHDFELKPGENVTVKYAVASCTGDLVALELTNAAGETLVLRDGMGGPRW